MQTRKLCSGSVLRQQAPSCVLAFIKQAVGVMMVQAMTVFIFIIEINIQVNFHNFCFLKRKHCLCLSQAVKYVCLCEAICLQFLLRLIPAPRSTYPLTPTLRTTLLTTPRTTLQTTPQTTLNKQPNLQLWWEETQEAYLLQQQQQQQSYFS